MRNTFVLAAVFLMLVFLSCVYPLCSDDYTYSYIIEKGFISDERVTGLSDIFQSQYNHYLYYHGRVWAQSLVQFFLLIGKDYYPFIFLICYASCVALICRLAEVKGGTLFSLVALSFWLLLPVPGQTLLWLCGSCNYIWVSFFILLYLYCLLSEKKGLVYISLPLAFIAGNAHEGVSCGFFAAMLLYSALARRKGVLHYLSLFLLLLGVLSYFAAPGSGSRINLVSHSAVEGNALLRHLGLAVSGVISMLRILASRVPEMWLIVVLLFTSVGANVMYRKCRGHFHALAASLCFGACINFLLPMAANVVYPRACYGASFLSLVSIYILLLPRVSKRTAVISQLVFLAVNVFAAEKAYHQISLLRDKEEYIIGQIRKQETMIMLPERYRHVGGRYVETYGQSSSYVFNLAESRYYGGARHYSVIDSPVEQALLQQFDYKVLPNQRVRPLPSGGAMVHLDEPHKIHFATLPAAVIATDDSFFGRLKRAIFPPAAVGVPTAAVLKDGEYWILVNSPAENIRLEVQYGDGRAEVFCINPSTGE